MPNVNYAAEYSAALAQAYPYLSYFGAIWASNNSNRYKHCDITNDVHLPSGIPIHQKIKRNDTDHIMYVIFKPNF